MHWKKHITLGSYGSEEGAASVYDEACIYQVSNKYIYQISNYRIYKISDCRIYQLSHDCVS